MTYTPSTDFVGLWRAIAGGVEKAEIPGLDLVVAALGRAGLLSVTVSSTAPVANQSTTAWFQPASPSYSAEGALYLWNATASAYQAATPALFQDYLTASLGLSGVSIWSGAALPANTVGNNGDFFILTASPGGVYGPKAAGAWPATPVPGTGYANFSAGFDYAFANTQGSILYRGASSWAALAPGAAGNVLATGGTGANPYWANLSSTASSSALDTAFGSTVGSMLYRASGGWTALTGGTQNEVLSFSGTSVPFWAALSNVLDSVLAAGSPTVGDVAYRGSGGWTVLTPGTSGYVLTTQGSGAAPIWAAGSAGTVNSAALDSAFGATVGGVLVRNSSGWTNMGAGTAGYYLTAQGVGSNPTWTAPATATFSGTALAVGSVALLYYNTTGGNVTAGSLVTAGGSPSNLFYLDSNGTNYAIGVGQVWRCLGMTQEQFPASGGFSSDTGVAGLWYRVS